jgi:ElaB/YqjD/DUF883 family membrane-anchored ribosome-binding protein
MADNSNAAGRAAQKTAPSVEGIVSDAQDKGTEAVDAVRDVGANIVEAIDRSLEKRPYTTLILALAIGFLLGATRRR